MFYSLRGKLIAVDGLSVAIECAGVGYKCNVTQNTLNELPAIGEEVFIYTHLNVREDAMELFGFFSLSELNCFKLLTSVSGVGAKVGIAILSTLSAAQVVAAISSGDCKLLTLAPGVGNKLAQRIILELKDKVASSLAEVSAKNPPLAASRAVFGNSAAAIDALSVLGYSRVEALEAVSKFDEALSVEELIKNALKSMAGGI